jgi:hypothetical protein
MRRPRPTCRATADTDAPAPSSRIVRARSKTRCGEASERLIRSSSWLSSSVSSMRRSVFHMPTIHTKSPRMEKFSTDHLPTGRCTKGLGNLCKRAPDGVPVAGIRSGLCPTRAGHACGNTPRASTSAATSRPAAYPPRVCDYVDVRAFRLEVARGMHTLALASRRHEWQGQPIPRIS